MRRALVSLAVLLILTPVRGQEPRPAEESRPEPRPLAMAPAEYANAWNEAAHLQGEAMAALKRVHESFWTDPVGAVVSLKRQEDLRVAVAKMRSQVEKFELLIKLETKVHRP